MAGIVDVLIPAFPRVVVTQTDSDRALSAEELAALVDADKLAGVYPSVSEALAAFDAAGEPFVAAGTITLAGEVAGDCSVNPIPSSVAVKYGLFYKPEASNSPYITATQKAVNLGRAFWLPCASS